MKLQASAFKLKLPFARNIFLSKRLRKYRCYKYRICSTLSAANITIQQEIIVVAITIMLCVFTRYWCAPTHRVARN